MNTKLLFSLLLISIFTCCNKNTDQLPAVNAPNKKLVVSPATRNAADMDFIFERRTAEYSKKGKITLKLHPTIRLNLNFCNSRAYWLQHSLSQTEMNQPVFAFVLLFQQCKDSYSTKTWKGKSVKPVEPGLWSTAEPIRAIYQWCCSEVCTT